MGKSNKRGAREEAMIAGKYNRALTKRMPPSRIIALLEKYKVEKTK
ncbi:hypothetical protein [Vibrio alginolyticus]|nr:hypothetical protein [Vibrio alginolyticus]CAH7192407.1 hypothetical protein VCHA51O444_10620 [Vibrio chagasii]CAH7360094.1 hypothetical protein VCHA53O474_30426 [Vibrio chagasii]